MDARRWCCCRIFTSVASAFAKQLGLDSMFAYRLGAINGTTLPVLETVRGYVGVRHEPLLAGVFNLFVFENHLAFQLPHKIRSPSPRRTSTDERRLMPTKRTLNLGLSVSVQLGLLGQLEH
jgi:hypothetical protein